MQLTLRFENPFYVGILEQERGGRLYAARHVFGAEPSNEVVYAWVLGEVNGLCRRMTAGIALDATEGPRRINPKRLQREIRRALEAPATSTKAQEACAATRSKIRDAPEIGGSIATPIRIAAGGSPGKGPEEAPGR